MKSLHKRGALFRRPKTIEYHLRNTHRKPQPG